jgi:uroporphyrinogen-III synthase
MSSLNGKTIVITRPRNQSEEFVRLLSREGAEAIVFPTIEIAPPESWSECDKAIAKLDSYDGVVFSSSNAVENFFQRLGENKIHILRKCSVYVVGEKTYSAISHHGIMSVAPPEIHDGEHLAQIIIADGVKGKRFLIPKGNKGRATVKDELLKNGADVDDVTVYRTVAPASTETETIKKLLIQKRIDAVTFFSPSSVENFLSVVSLEGISAVAVAVIGKTTAEAASHFGLNVHAIAEPSTSEGMVEALKKYF